VDVNVFFYYKTLRIHLDNIVAIIFQENSLSCQGRGKCLQLSQNNNPRVFAPRVFRTCSADISIDLLINARRNVCLRFLLSFHWKEHCRLRFDQTHRDKYCADPSCLSLARFGIEYFAIRIEVTCFGGKESLA